MSVLTVDHIYKSFDDIQAVQDLNLELSEGVIFGLLGPNGAGKTTTIRMIMDIIIPDKGEIRLFEKPNSQALRNNVGYLPEERGLYRKMKIGDLLTFLAEMKGMKSSESKKKIRAWLERFALMDWIDKKVEELSRGMQQKIQFIATIIHEPKLIILDEPFTGLDPVNTDLIKDIMIEQKEKGATIIFSTHLMEQVEKLCESICLINEGKAVLNGEIKQIKKNFSKRTIRIEFEGQPEFLQNKNLVKNFKEHDNYVEILPNENTSVNQILQTASQQVDIFRFELMEPTLHDIFIETVTNKK